MIPQGIEIVQKAIAADGEGDYEKALALYRDALQRFTLGLKYEKNAARKKLILERTQGYMDRAEELAEYVKKQNELDKGGGGGGTAAKAKGDGDDGGDDADKKKLRGALAAAIVSENCLGCNDGFGIKFFARHGFLKQPYHHGLGTSVLPRIPVGGLGISTNLLNGQERVLLSCPRVPYLAFEMF